MIPLSQSESGNVIATMPAIISYNKICMHQKVVCCAVDF